MLTSTVQRAARRLFCSPADPKQLLEALESERGAFIPTRAAFHLAERAVLALEVEHVAGTLEVPIVIVGRRAQSGANAGLMQGVVARIGDASDARVQRARDALGKRAGVVDVPAGIGRSERLFFARYLRRNGR